MLRLLSSAWVLLLLAAPLSARDGVVDPGSARSPDGKLHAQGDGKVVSIYDVNTNKLRCQIRAHNDTVTAVAFSPDGKGLASGDKGGVVCRVDASTGKLVWKHSTKGSVKSLSYSKDGKTLTATMKDKTTKKLDAATGKLIE
jgi:WD40 repeat protein